MRLLYNIKAQMIQCSENNFYEELMALLKKEDPGNCHKLGLDEEEGKLYVFYYQNGEMREMYKKYGQMIFIDGTYKINKNN